MDSDNCRTTAGGSMRVPAGGAADPPLCDCMPLQPAAAPANNDKTKRRPKYLTL
jgi:hypothetical protein